MDISDYIKYDNGVIRWKRKTGRSTQIGKEIGVNNGKGYLTFKFNGRRLKVHRVIWELHNGKIPDGMEIDHINHKRDDNRIENLRIVSRDDNMRNKSIYKNSSSGYCGVCLRSSGKWFAYIQNKSKQVSLGQFDTIEEAVSARLEAERLYGFHDNHGL